MIDTSRGETIMNELIVFGVVYIGLLLTSITG